MQYNAALLSICFMILLGFVDDALDIPWRFKILLPSIAIVPLLVSYSGETSIIIPTKLANIIHINRIQDLGLIYHLYMLLLCIFCGNAINIHAGINGLEAGQSFIIGIFILIHNIYEIKADDQGREQHILSIFLISPFIASTAGLLYYNWYPSKVFVGDTYTLFAGMTLGVSSILGHFTKTLLLFFIPQILNFVYSIPQLFGLFGYHCPRHRLPKYNSNTKLLEGNKNYLNLVNLCLNICGPMNERNLCITLLSFQFIVCTFGLYLRYNFENWLY